MNITLPDEIREFYFDFHWDNQKVWALETFPRQVRTESLLWQLLFPIWSSAPPQPLFDLRPIDVITGEIDHPIHRERIARADLSFPLDAMFFRERIVILDGFHRLARNVMEKQRFTQIRIHGEEVIPRIQRVAAQQRCASESLPDSGAEVVHSQTK